MHDIFRLNKDLKQTEYEAATSFYNQLIESGFVTQKAVALVYRAGLVDGRAQARERAKRDEYYTERAAQLNSVEGEANV